MDKVPVDFTPLQHKMVNDALEIHLSLGFLIGIITTALVVMGVDEARHQQVNRWVIVGAAVAFVLAVSFGLLTVVTRWLRRWVHRSLDKQMKAEFGQAILLSSTPKEREDLVGIYRTRYHEEP